MKTLLIAATALSVLGAPLAVQAGPKEHGNPHGVPPGLSKKPYGMPPGQAKKLWAVGERLPPDYLGGAYVIYQPTRYQLPPPPYGYRWVRVDDQFYLAQTGTGLIAQVIAALAR